MASHSYTLLLAMVVAGASWAAFGLAGGMAVVAILLAVAIHCWAGKSGWSPSFRIAAGMLWFLALICLLVPVVIAGRDVARCAQCKNNLKQIGFALRSYGDTHGCFPPPCTYDEAGRPMCSWRLLIKPYLDCSPMYMQWDFKEPWNGPSNGRLRAKYECVYKCPMDQTACAPDSTCTSYVAVVGRRVALEREKEPNREGQDLQKQPPNTFLVIEMADSGIEWAEPKDIHCDAVQGLRWLAAKGPHRRNNGYFFHDTPGVNAILVDGDMIFTFWCDSTANVLTALLPPTVSETAGRHDKADYVDHFCRLYSEELRAHWPHRIGLPVWLVAVGLLTCHIRTTRAGQARTDVCGKDKSKG